MRSVEETVQGLVGNLSLWARVRCLVQLFGSGAAAVLIAVLWWTEDGLPVRTQVAFAVLIAIGIGWVVYAARELAGRGRLLAGDRVIAGWLALGFAGLLALGLVLRQLPVLGAVPVVLAGGYLATAYVTRRRLRQRLKAEKSGG